MKRRRLTKSHSTKKKCKSRKHKTRKADSKKHVHIEVKVHHKY